MDGRSPRYAARRFLGLLTLLCLLAPPALAQERPRAILELFTSQSCASCPPADSLVSKLKGRGDVIVLTMPVDYWDYLGWRDTLAKRAFTRRQKAYAEARGDRKVYTPQVVVNGLDHAVGSDEAAIRGAIDESAPGERCMMVDASIRREGDTLAVSLGGGDPAHADAEVLIAVFDERVPVHVEKGENSGKRLVYHNVVRQLTTVGKWHGEPMDLRIDDIRLESGQGAAVLVQDVDRRHPGPVLAGAIVTME